jgi:hypothetical protein
MMESGVCLRVRPVNLCKAFKLLTNPLVVNPRFRSISTLILQEELQEIAVAALANDVVVILEVEAA